MQTIWREFVDRHRKCSRCRNEGLLDTRSLPLFAKRPPRSFEILFILEAPNRDDTYNPNKRYITVDPSTDPSGRFFHDLFINELRFSFDDLFITNSVLCLPVEKAGKFPVSTGQRNNCLPILKQMINDFCPLIVCPMGTRALIATEQLYPHGYRTMAEAVAIPTPWYGRVLFPLFHTSGQARNPRNGRPEPQQRADWRRLRVVWEESKAKHSP
jgi:uracil-DNA glycosylase